MEEDFDLELEVDLDDEASSIEITKPIILEKTIGSSDKIKSPEEELKLQQILHGDGSAVRVDDEGNEQILLGEGAKNSSSKKLLLEAKKKQMLLGQSKDKPLMIEMDNPNDDDIEIDDEDLGIPTNIIVLDDNDDDLEIDLDGEITAYELAAATDVSLEVAQQIIIKRHLDESYPQQEDEVFLVRTDCEEIHEIIHQSNKHLDRAKAKLVDYLDDPKFNIFPKNVKALSSYDEKPKKIRPILVDLLQKFILQNDSSPKIIRKVTHEFMEDYRKEELGQADILAIDNLLTDIINFAIVTYNIAKTAANESKYHPKYETLKTPSLVSNFEYQCDCGGSAQMPLNAEGRPRPVLCFLIAGGTTENIRLMNEPVPCNECGQYLALSHSLAQAIQASASTRIKVGNYNKYAEYRIYRPALADLKDIIPGDARGLFHLDVANIVDTEISTGTQVTMKEVAYRRLIKLWMGNKLVKSELESKLKEVGERDLLYRNLIRCLAQADFSKPPALISYQFQKSLIHFLEKFSLFSITPEKDILYDVYKREKYDRFCFDDDFAIKWLDDNAANLAGLNNIYSGDLNVGSIVIKPNFLPVINKITLLHLLSDNSLLASGEKGHARRYINNPLAENPVKKKLMDYETSKVDGINTVPRYFYESKKPKGFKYAWSKREFRDSGIIYPVEAWGDLHEFLVNVGDFIIKDEEVTQEEIDLVSEAKSKSREEFYGIDKLPEHLLVQPTFRFSEFKNMFNKYGHYLLTGLILDEERRHLANFFTLYVSLQPRKSLTELFKQSSLSESNLGIILDESNTKKYDEKELLEIKLSIILNSVDLPPELNDIRDEHGVEALVNAWDVTRDELMNFPSFVEKYKEVL